MTSLTTAAALPLPLDAGSRLAAAAALPLPDLGADHLSSHGSPAHSCIDIASTRERPTSRAEDESAGLPEQTTEGLVQTGARCTLRTPDSNSSTPPVLPDSCGSDFSGNDASWGIDTNGDGIPSLQDGASSGAAGGFRLLVCAVVWQEVTWGFVA
jgi:hypothetical protein